MKKSQSIAGRCKLIPVCYSISWTVNVVIANVGKMSYQCYFFTAVFSDIGLTGRRGLALQVGYSDGNRQFFIYKLQVSCTGTECSHKCLIASQCDIVLYFCSQS